ncbi:DNA primase family protein [Rhizobium leguminosarum]|uniref:DNA primase family protein n=1 Tax=Rhizobium leguminosarum TaxID=384 RepID=UPI001558469A|nr:phage/plasmid primase, P4 family [Rhizobium leguminosarum]
MSELDDVAELFTGREIVAEALPARVPMKPVVHVVHRAESNDFDFAALHSKRASFPVGELSKKDPLDWARAFLLEQCSDGQRLIAFWQRKWWVWREYWRETSIEAVRGMVFAFFDGKTVSNWDADKPEITIKRMKPDSSMVSQTIDALTAFCMIADDVAPFTWQASGLDPDFLLPVQNGILNLLTGQLIPHTPEFMATGVADWEWTGAAPDPARFMGFVRSLWPSDRGEVALLQEVMGWLLSGDTTLQKIPFLKGPPRAGKGTLIRLLQNLLGDQRYVPVNAYAFGSEFGFSETIGKRLAISGDLRLGAKTDAAAIEERLLQVSGGDTIRVGRKYGADWRGAATARILISANDIPKLPDASGALANRYVPLDFRVQFLGKEDTRLDSDLRAEAEGIAAWALAGLRRLMTRGRFELPVSSQALIDRAQNLGSPVRQFAMECCRLHAELRTPVDEIYRAYTEWCTESGNRPLAKNSFGENLQSAYPALRTGRMPGGRGEKRPTAYLGIGLSFHGSNPDTAS